MKPRTPSMYPRRDPSSRWGLDERPLTGKPESGVLPREREVETRFSSPSSRARIAPASPEPSRPRSSAPRLALPVSEPRTKFPSSAPRLSIPVAARRPSLASSEPRIVSHASILPGLGSRPSEARSLSARKEHPVARWVAGKPPAHPSLVAITTGVQMDALKYTHAFIAAYLRQRFSPSLAEPLTIAAHELLDNALNYGSVSEPVLVELLETPALAAVRVSNASIAARVDVLVSHIERLGGPGPVFVEEIRRGLAREMSRPMLGLARILHEASLDLDLHVDDNRVAVAARRDK